MNSSLSCAKSYSFSHILLYLLGISRVLMCINQQKRHQDICSPGQSMNQRPTCHTRRSNADDDWYCFPQSQHSPTTFPRTSTSRTFYVETAGLQVNIWMNCLILASSVSAVDTFLLEKTPHYIVYRAKSCIRVTVLPLT